MNLSKRVTEIEFIDRPRIVDEIFQVFGTLYLDKSSLEILPRNGNNVMSVRFHNSTPETMQQLFRCLGTVHGIISTVSVDYMPHEKQQHLLRTILNSVGEGIIAFTADGQIKHMNNHARQIFAHHTDDSAINADMLFPANSPVFEALKYGKACTNIEQPLHRPGGILHSFISCTPIIDTQGNVSGAVVVLKDYEEAEDITSKVNRKRNLITFDSIIHQSSIIKQLIETAKLVSHGTSTVLLHGESGTGKELFARAIHRESGRRSAPFIAINCGALPDSLLEAELFGYEAGAFTGAVKGGKKGLFEEACGGTIFLDEIGEVSRSMQVKLLRVLQEQEVRRIGSSRNTIIDVRIIAATNRDLQEMILAGQFREDLYYRLNVIPITIPPLRERREDIPLIAQHLVRKICLKLGKNEKYLTPESLTMLIKLDYPGNIRQLENLLELAVNLEYGNEILPHHFNKYSISAPPSPALAYPTVSENLITVPIPADGNWQPLKEIIGQVEKEILQQVLIDYPSSRKAGNALGLSNTAILKKIHKYEINL